MIKHFIKFSTLSLIVLLGFTSCKSDSDDFIELPKGDFDNGYFISNEGNFGTPNASITFIGSDLTEPINNIFQKVNGSGLGDVLQDVAFDDDYAFMVVNNSNKIEVVNRYTFQSVATITEKISQPRFAVVEEGKLYVTNSATNSVEIFDAKSFAHLTTIEVNKAVEEIKEDNDFIYVMNTLYDTNYNNISNNITVIDSKTNTIIKDITVGIGLNSIEIEDGILYALHNTGITKITTSNNAVIGEIAFAEGLTNANKLEIEDNFIYFVSGSKIFKFNKDVMSLTNTELLDTQVSDESYFIGYGFNVVNDKIFYTDVKGFTQNSEVKVYDLDGKLLKTFTAGIGANGVYEND
ncbi:hypothetical protein LX77_01561 [Gelidibacter algens]|uniref:YVTN family beta-propeller protein n=1 Tax=Gelidibacter algens TaxID=49280 RepID=A0A1A7R111_9FLAO|nr:DUF5074 domain-containing protein [Gelidibacter algens]OBX25940.1 hypothetical protein A9996_07420 [Gelidibacter algens]RAJ25258.1 hypothetical protein LX77_01561 [Gelidibacter algens]